MSTPTRPTDSPPAVRFGVDVLLSDPERWRDWHRVGLVTNDAARLAAHSTVQSRIALQRAGVPLVRLFGPEHGLGAVAADGEAVTDGVDAATGLPVVSLYGERMRPAPEHLADLDVLCFDIPDVGARFYTYAWTLWHAIHACEDAGVRLIVLDRPNPLGGVLAAAEGPILDDACRSFIGEHAIPIRHALTLGELARLWVAECAPRTALTVVPCDGWDASRSWEATGCDWVPTSPAMPHAECAVWYPGTCLFEATNVSVARGTGAPFATIGAPWLDATSVIAAVATMRAPYAPAASVALEATTFAPTLGPSAGESCVGIRLTITAADRTAFIARDFRPVQLGLVLLDGIARQHPKQFAWARYPTAANPRGDDHFARLVGRADVGARIGAPRETPLDATRGAHDGLETWTRATEWAARVAPFLLYRATTR